MATVSNNDPLLSSQWHIRALLGPDPNKIWEDYTGKGVKVGVYDDGLDKNHADLRANYDASKELTYGGLKADPSTGSGVHGTSVAGIIAASANNGVGGVGIAHGATVTGVNIFSGAAYNNYIASIRAMSSFDVTNSSWGWTSKYADNSAVLNSFGDQFVKALAYAADAGRGGKGTVIVNSAGNDALTGREANDSEFNASRHTITVGAIGQDGDVAAYSTRGSSVLVSAPTSGGGSGITTTDKTGSAGYSSGDFTYSFGGTSAAAPVVSGLVTLMLEANPGLGWRDIQDILTYTADHTTPTALNGGISGRMEYGWTMNKADNANGGGLHYSNDVGYGMVDGFEAIRYAEVWSKFGPAETSANEAKASVSTAVNKAITDNATTTFTMNLANSIEIEHAALTLTLTHGNVNDLRIELVSPEGTRSILLDATTGVTAFNNTTWTYGTDALRGELSNGTWTVRVTDTKTGYTGTVVNAKLEVFGDTPSVNDVYHYNDEFFKMLSLDASRGILKDTDGGIDWINASANVDNTVINLNAGQSSTFGGKVAFTIASGTVIENAVSGDGNDILIGNASANELMGGRGNDTLEGRGGADILNGGAGTDTASYVSSAIAVDVDLKRATQIGGDAQGDTLISIENLTGSNLNDVLRGDDGVNVILGGKGNDVIEGRGGADILDGGDGIDTLDYISSGMGVQIDLALRTARGGDAEGDVFINFENVRGSNFNDTLRGDAGNNVLRGEGGNDTLHGGDGDDILVGGAGNDALYGGNGRDIFLYEKSGGAYGTDCIGDFQQGQDKIQFTGYGISFKDLQITSKGAVTTIDFANDGGSIMVMTNAKLVASDFLFA